MYSTNTILNSPSHTPHKCALQMINTKIPSLQIWGGFAKGTPMTKDEIHPILMAICGWFILLDHKLLGPTKIYNALCMSSLHMGYCFGYSKCGKSQTYPFRHKVELQQFGWLERPWPLLLTTKHGYKCFALYIKIWDGIPCSQFHALFTPSRANQSRSYTSIFK